MITDTILKMPYGYACMSHNRMILMVHYLAVSEKRGFLFPKVCISHFPLCSVFSPYSRSFSVHFSFFKFFSDIVIFQVVKWMFLIFHDFQFSCHIPCPIVDICKFSTYFSFPRHISRPKVCISHFP